MKVDTSEVKVANRPVYIRAVQPVTGHKAGQASLTTSGKFDDEETASAAGRGEARTMAEKKDEKLDNGKTNGNGKAEAEPAPEDEYYPSSGDNYYEEEKKEKNSGLKSILPPSLDSLVDQASEVTEFLGQASPGQVEVVGPVQRGNRVMMMMSAPVAEDLTVHTTISAPLGDEAPLKPVVTTVAVNTDTGEVVAKEKDHCDHVDEVPTVAIGQVVDVVLEAREEMDNDAELTAVAAEIAEAPSEAAREEETALVGATEG